MLLSGRIEVIYAALRARKASAFLSNFVWIRIIVFLSEQ